MHSNKLFHWEKSFTSTLLRLSIPIMVQSLVLASMHIVDNLMIGQLGEIELAGVTQANRITFLFQLTMFGTVGGASVFTAQYWGQRDVAAIRRFLGLGLSTALVIAAVFLLPSVIAPEALLGILIKDKSAIDAGAAYLRIVGFSYAFQALSLTYSAVLKSTEQVKLPMNASVSAIALNTGLNYILIYGKFGFPRMGVEGAALATLIGCALELFLLVFFSYRYDFATAAKPHELKLSSRDMIPKYFRVVLPVTLNECFWSLGMVMYSIAYGRMGTGAVAAVSIFNNVEQLASVAIRGTTSACAVMVGREIGARREKDAMLYSGRMILGNIALGVVIGAGVFAFAGNIVSLFKVSPSTAADARMLINIYSAFAWIGSACNVIIVGILRPGGDVRYSMVLDVAPGWLLCVPLVFLCGPFLGWPVPYVYLLTTLENIIKMIIGIRRIRSGRWIHNLTESAI